MVSLAASLASVVQDLDLAGEHREVEPGRRHANDGVRLAIQRDGAADNRAVGAESLRPQLMAEDDDVLSLLFLARREAATEGGADAERRKQVPGDNLSGQLHGLAPARQRHLVVAERDQMVQRPGAAPEVEEDRVRHGVRVGDVALVDQADRHQPPGVGKRQWRQQHRLNDAEDHDVGAHAEGERHHRRQGERGRPPELPDGAARVGPGILDTGPPPHRAAALLDDGGVAELASGTVQGVVWRQSLFHQRVGALGDVGPDLLREVGVELAAVEERANPVHGFAGARTSRMPSSMRS